MCKVKYPDRNEITLKDASNHVKMIQYVEDYPRKTMARRKLYFTIKTLSALKKSYILIYLEGSCTCMESSLKDLPVLFFFLCTEYRCEKQ